MEKKLDTKELLKIITIYLSLLGYVVSLCFYLFDIHWAWYQPAIFATIFILPIPISEFGFTTTAKYALLFIIYSATTFNILTFGLESNILILHVCLSTLPLLIFELYERKHILLGLAIWGAYSTIAINFDKATPLYTALDTGLLHVLSFISIFIAACALIGSMILFKAALIRYETKLQANLDRTDELFQERKLLVKVLCHDIVNPLMVIMISADKLVSRLQGEGADVFLRRVREGADSINEMLVSVRLLERYGLNNLQVELKPVSVVEVLEKIHDRFHDEAERKGLQLKLLLNKETELFCIAEEKTLKNQVIANLVFNAIKFTKQGCINIEACRSDSGVTIKVKDTGIGMPDEIMKQIREGHGNYVRVGTDGEEGLGFGMTLARNFVTLYGGNLIIQSKQQTPETTDHGTEITIQLPSAFS
ncbi:MAG: HAMP domain-containing histidine kinase [Deltaproteobacteria bacterium]|nr:HAMP domain-containing histidine kinase [Deltaproteobacteria bacterium]